MKNPSSFLVTLAADAAAVTTSLVPSLHLAPIVQAVIIGIAGLMTTAHVHLPKFLTSGSAGKIEGDLGQLFDDVLGMVKPTAPTPQASTANVYLNAPAPQAPKTNPTA